MDFWIIPVGFLHSSFKVINDQCLRNSAEIVKRIFNRRNEVVGRLPPHNFAVGFPRTAQDNAKHPGTTLLSVSINDISGSAEIDLSFLAGFRFHSTKRQWYLLSQILNETPDAVIASRKAIVDLQILMNSHGRQPCRKLLFNELAIVAAQTFRPRATWKTRLRRSALRLVRPGERVWPVLSRCALGFVLKPGARVWPVLNLISPGIRLVLSLRFVPDLPHMFVDRT